jgi:hypothetical protein
MATRKLTLADQIARAKKHLADLEAKEKAGKFDTALAKHKNAINSIYADLKAASGKQRGVDSAILVTITKALFGKKLHKV